MRVTSYWEKVKYANVFQWDFRADQFTEFIFFEAKLISISFKFKFNSQGTARFREGEEFVAYYYASNSPINT